MTDRPASEPRDRGLLLLGLALLLGAVRFWKLGEWSLWIDEALTVADYTNRPTSAGNPVGYLLIRATVEALGGRPDELALRFLPALVGWLTIPLCFLGLRPCVGGRRAGLCVLLLAVSSWHLYWSQNARFYTFAQALSFAGVCTCLGAQVRGRWLSGLVGFGLAGAAFLLHPSTILALPPLVGMPFLARLCGVRLPAVTTRLSLALLAASLVGLAVVSGKLLGMWGEYAYDKSAGSPANLILTSGYYFTPVILGSAAVGLVLVLRRREPYSLAVALLCLGAALLALAASFVARVVAQYVFFLLPWVLLLAVEPVAFLLEEDGSERARSRRLVGAGLAAILVATSLSLTGLYLTSRRGERPRWREAFQYVEDRRAPSDGIFAMAAPIGEYYLSPRTPDYRRPRHVAWFDRYRPNLAENWARRGRRIWFVVCPKNFDDWSPAEARRVREFLRQECRLEAEFPLTVDVRDLSLRVYVLN